MTTTQFTTLLPALLGSVVEFTDRWGETLTGVIVGTRQVLNQPKDYTLWCQTTETAYGMGRLGFTVLHTQSPMGRLKNLRIAEHQTFCAYAAYPAWQTTLLMHCPYRFYGPAIDAVHQEVKAQAH